MDNYLKKLALKSLIVGSILSIYNLQAIRFQENILLSALPIKEESSSVTFKNKKEAISTLTGAHSFFTLDNLLVTRISPQNYARWQSILKGTEDFVTKNDKSLLKYFTTLSEVNNKILNTLKVIYGGFIAPAIIDQKFKETGIPELSSSLIKVEAFQLDPIKNELNKLVPLKKDTADVEKSLKDKILISPSARDARELLLAFANVMNSILDKTTNDYQKLKDFKFQTIVPPKFAEELRTIAVRPK